MDVFDSLDSSSDLLKLNGHEVFVNGMTECDECFVFQHNCPVGNVDLQGRTALHDAGKHKALYILRFCWN